MKKLTWTKNSYGGYGAALPFDSEASCFWGLNQGRWGYFAFIGNSRVCGPFDDMKTAQLAAQDYVDKEYEQWAENAKSEVEDGGK